MNRHDRRKQGVNIGATDLRYGGATVSVFVHIAFPPDIPRDVMVRCGNTASEHVWRAAKGFLLHMTAAAASIEPCADGYLVKIICMVNTPESLEDMQPRIMAAMAKGTWPLAWPVVHCALGEMEPHETAGAWKALRERSWAAGAREPS